MTQVDPKDAIQEEACLLAEVGSGNEESFAEIYTRYHEPLYSLAVRMLRNTQEAEEVLQDSFVKIWKNAAKFDSTKSRPFTWAVTITKRTCIDRMRKRKLQYADSSIEENDANTPFTSNENIRKSAELSDETARVRKALDEIPEKQSAALELALFSEMTHTEIANQLEQPLGTVKSWLKRGLFQLRNKLTEPKE